MNGDGFADLIVGAPGGDDGGTNAGEAYVVFGKASGFGTTVNTGGFDRQVIDLTTLSAADGFIIQGDTAGDYAGGASPSAGDVNGDGFDDLIVGAPWATMAAPMPARPMWCSARRRASAPLSIPAVRPAGDRPHDALRCRRLHHPGRCGAVTTPAAASPRRAM